MRLTWLREYPVPVVAVAVIIVCAVIVTASAGVTRMLAAAPAADTTANPNCTIIVPADPLSARGLATPYQLTATNPADGPCHEADPDQAVFVQGAVLNPATGQITVYDPLVVDAGTQPAVAPVVPVLPADAVVGLWFGDNGTSLTLAGADQGQPSAQAGSSAVTASAGTASAGTASAGTATVNSGTATVNSGTATANSGTATVNSGTATANSGTATANSGARAAVESAGSAPLPPGQGGNEGWFNASLTRLGQDQGTATAGTAVTPAMTPAVSVPALPDPILRQADCVGGADIDATFSSFTQVAACDAAAFFAAADAAIRAGRLMTPAPGTAADGEACPTTRSFALVDQHQSDNVTTEYLATAGGLIAQDTAANRTSLRGASTLVNGGDNALLDMFVDPSLGCAPWEAANLADAGAPASALPLDELQAAAWAGRQGDGPAALVPLNDPLTLDPDGQFTAVKTDAYRSLVDMPALPAGQSPAAYCADLESIQGARLQQDVNLLLQAPSPQPSAANSLFTFLARRLRQSFADLRCGDYGLASDVSTTADGNGVVVAACFAHQVGAITPGPGNPTAGKTVCQLSIRYQVLTAAGKSVMARRGKRRSVLTHPPGNRRQGKRRKVDDRPVPAG